MCVFLDMVEQEMGFTVDKIPSWMTSSVRGRNKHNPHNRSHWAATRWGARWRSDSPADCQRCISGTACTFASHLNQHHHSLLCHGFSVPVLVEYSRKRHHLLLLISGIPAECRQQWPHQWSCTWQWQEVAESQSHFPLSRGDVAPSAPRNRSSRPAAQPGPRAPAAKISLPAGSHRAACPHPAGGTHDKGVAGVARQAQKTRLSGGRTAVWQTATHRAGAQEESTLSGCRLTVEGCTTSAVREQWCKKSK